MWRLASLLWAEHKFNCVITQAGKKGREDVNDDVSSNRPSTSIADGNIESVKKMILEHSAHAKQFLRMV